MSNEGQGVCHRRKGRLKCYHVTNETFDSFESFLEKNLPRNITFKSVDGTIDLYYYGTLYFTIDKNTKAVFIPIIFWRTRSRNLTDITFTLKTSNHE